jgi:hypothetical protein
MQASSLTERSTLPDSLSHSKASISCATFSAVDITICGLVFQVEQLQHLAPVADPWIDSESTR